MKSTNQSYAFLRSNEAERNQAVVESAVANHQEQGQTTRLVEVDLPNYNDATNATRFMHAARDSLPTVVDGDENDVVFLHMRGMNAASKVVRGAVQRLATARRVGKYVLPVNTVVVVSAEGGEEVKVTRPFSHGFFAFSSEETAEEVAE